MTVFPQNLPYDTEQPEKDIQIKPGESERKQKKTTSSSEHKESKTIREKDHHFLITPFVY